jgi:hypothetical protein
MRVPSGEEGKALWITGGILVGALGFEPRASCSRIPASAQMIFTFCLVFQPFTGIGTICFRSSQIPLNGQSEWFWNTFGAPLLQRRDPAQFASLLGNHRRLEVDRQPTRD